MNRRAFFKRLGVAAGVVVAAPVIARLPLSAAGSAHRVLTFKGMEVVISDYVARDTIILCSPSVARAYKELTRSDQVFWKAQR